MQNGHVVAAATFLKEWDEKDLHDFFLFVIFLQAVSG